MAEQLEEGRSERIAWSLPDPFAMERTVAESELDRLGHVNNAVYLQWCEGVAWRHAESIGVGWSAWRELDRALAVIEVRLAYRQPARAGDRVRVGNWIVRNDGRLRATRRFEVHRVDEPRLLLEGEIDYVCIEISSGRPRRLPAEFARAYAVLPSVAAALRAQARGSQTAGS